ncbi:MAG: CIA30 family protein [Pirellulales bacterium]
MWIHSLRLAAMLTIFSLAANAEDRVLFRFDEPDAVKRWQAVNDGVMGGRSQGRFRINEDKRIEFFGRLSLANNGGFASVRARGSNLALTENDVIVARVKGDGREYKFNVYTRRIRGGYSYRQSFKTTKDEWIDVELPVEKFVATWRGRVFRNKKLDPTKVGGLGFLLGDKKPGPFKLEIEWIKVAQVQSDD